MPPRSVVWIDYLFFSPHVERKLPVKHGVLPVEVEQVCLYGAPESTVWVEDVGHGLRLRVEGATRAGRKLTCWLAHTELQGQSVWVVKTAREVS